MSYQAKIIIFSDLDSTLLRDNHFFSKKTKETVKKLYEQGIFLIPVTARATSDLLSQAKRLGLDKLGGIAAANNGSQIYDFKNQKWIVNEYVPDDIVKDAFINNFDKYIAKIHFFGDETTYVFNEGKNSMYWAQMMGHDYVAAHDISEIDSPIAHFTIILKKDISKKESDAYLANIKTKYGNRTNILVYTNRVIEVAPLNTNKGFAVKSVIKYLKLDDSVKSYAFGDGYNDLPMFDAVNIGVAMENGTHELKDIADDITEQSNEQDGVVNYIIKNILEK